MKKDNEQSSAVAGKFYEEKDYHRNDEVSIGLATTHEQVSDHYMGESAPPQGDQPAIPRTSNTGEDDNTI
ncbi:YozQ family protein [Bacillus canaveralius]|uniref:YozQ family protein n=1 Tax=Bacillus canaveralius TaxID=1403243 RepID=UPI0021ADE12D|nr:YozQ family protein [Bacillus canaveralius]